MKKNLSAYLDLMRISAAGLVFVSHLSLHAISGGFLWQLVAYSHGAVIVFFVLSGFVIQWVADEKEKTLQEFSVARLSRLYSVVLPAVLLTIICDWIGIHHNPAPYPLERETFQMWRGTIALLFLSQSWQHVSLLSNDAYWSLPHEAWYYVIFAIWTYLRGTTRVIWSAVSLAVAGPGILILFPIWLFGALTYRLVKRNHEMDKAVSRLTWSLSAFGILLVGKLDIINDPTTVWYLPNAINGLDFVLGALVAVNIYAANYLSFGLARFKKGIADVAGITFALYLFHLPLLHLAAAYLPSEYPSEVRGPLEALFALSIVYLLSMITERRKQQWRTFFHWLITAAQATRSRSRNQ